MGTKSYVKPICDPRVHSPLLVGLCVNINEIQSPCDKVGISKDLGKELEKLEKMANKINNELSQKDKGIMEELDEILGNCDDLHDHH